MEFYNPAKVPLFLTVAPWEIHAAVPLNVDLTGRHRGGRIRGRTGMVATNTVPPAAVTEPRALSHAVTEEDLGCNPCTMAW